MSRRHFDEEQKREREFARTDAQTRHLKTCKSKTKKTS
jgi:hypothetical protein